ncbi:hypothetical protein BRADI_2g47155v3 [Brachypodium distachyon]|uniref:Uncharacterized protein n=1 Tax=Brachypodium distachyon TaxID=15368 RepID=A0A2K2DE87_BRADI|nr:hypothetical protein BRADI_2g47155v3 [Brachypodium distachyon]
MARCDQQDNPKACPPVRTSITSALKWTGTRIRVFLARSEKCSGGIEEDTFAEEEEWSTLAY